MTRAVSFQQMRKMCRITAKAAPVLALAFSIVASFPAAAQTFTTLYGFTGGTDGGYPFAGVILDPQGNVYGTTYQGGDANCDANNPGLGCGTVFEVDSSGAFSIVYAFTSTADGYPWAGLIRDKSGNLYGTTLNTVFKISSSGAYSVLYTFSGGADGGDSRANLVMDQAGNLYGTTMQGGDLNCVIDNTAGGCGVVFKLDPSGKETVLHTFHGPDGGYPATGLTPDGQGNFYGTTSAGTGAAGAGTVFKLNPAGKFGIVHRFGGSTDGYEPEGSLIIDPQGNLYGTAVTGGGGSHYGTVYKIDKSGNETVLYAFTLKADGGLPYGNLVRDSAGNLYGTTELGGDLPCHGDGCGVIYELSPSGVETVLHDFEATPGELPQAGLVMAASGTLYGTTAGYESNFGSVFKFVP